MIPQAGERYRHKKRGSFYQIVGLATLQCHEYGAGDHDGSNELSDCETMVVYRAETDGTLWVRSEHEFMDGRFERIDVQSHQLAQIKLFDALCRIKALRQYGDHGACDIADKALAEWRALTGADAKVS